MDPSYLPEWKSDGFSNLTGQSNLFPTLKDCRNGQAESWHPSAISAQTSHKKLFFNHTNISDHAHAVLGDINHTHNHIYARSPPALIDSQADRAAKLLATILNAVKQYRASEDDARLQENWNEDMEAVARISAMLCPAPGNVPTTRIQSGPHDPLAAEDALTGNKGRPQKPRSSRTSSPPKSSPLNPMKQGVSLIKDTSTGETKLKLSSRFEPRAGHFYRAGRIFAVLWPITIPTTSVVTADPSATSGYSNEFHRRFVAGMQTSIRCMVVIRNRPGSCLCIHLATYGLKDKSLVPQNERIIAIEDIRKRSSRDRVGILLRSSTTTLGSKYSGKQRSARQFDYALPYCIDWNTAISDIGEVRKEDVSSLIVSARHNYSVIEQETNMEIG